MHLQKIILDPMSGKEATVRRKFDYNTEEEKETRDECYVNRVTARYGSAHLWSQYFRQRQGNCKVKDSLGYLPRPSLKKLK